MHIGQKAFTSIAPARSKNQASACPYCCHQNQIKKGGGVLVKTYPILYRYDVENRQFLNYFMLWSSIDKKCQQTLNLKG